MRRSTAVATSVLWFALTAGVGAVLVPWWLTGWRVQQPFPYRGLAQSVGVVLIVAGLIPAVHVFLEFVRAGGTPMPGAMPGRLVVTGFNRYVRNPIYLGAVSIFVGEALLLGQVSLLLYSLAAWLAVAAFVRWYEEPALARKFGADYEVYRRAVPAWIPRLRPWEPRALASAEDEHDDLPQRFSTAPGTAYQPRSEAPPRAQKGNRVKLTKSGGQTAIGPADWFTRTVYIDAIRNPDEQSAVGCAHVRFSPGARTAWHHHPKGQTLYVTDGIGYVARRGGNGGTQVQEIRPGDVVYIEPGEEHWHGATADRFMAHVAIQQADDDGQVVTWLEHVTDAEYGS